jgi:lipoic acid synthetase
MTAERKRVVQGEKLRGADKMARIPVKIVPTEEIPRKPDWLRVRMPASPEIARIKATLREHKLASVCEEANCPNLGECFSNGTATFMIMGEICTRRCPFCDVAHGRPNPLKVDEPKELAAAIRDMKLKYFVECIRETRAESPNIEIETLVPDFRGRMEVAIDTLSIAPPDVFNHNLESIPRLYRQVRPGSDYQWSLDLLKNFKDRCPDVPTKSGLMVGMGETFEEIVEVLKDLRAHNVDMLTIGQYLQPSKHHFPMARFVPPEEFARYEKVAKDLGFKRAACGPLVRSSYHADKQAHGEHVS